MPQTFREKGIFKSKKRAYAYAATLKLQGKTVRVEKHILPVYGGAIITGVAYSVRVKSGKDFFGRNYRIDTSE
jgi:hypothetical protein